MKFIVYAPPYNAHSAGISALYNLNDSLNQLGHSSEIMVFEQFRVYDSQAIVIYPEVISDNPLKAQRVVRYMFYFDGHISGRPIAPGPNDFILAWDRIFYPNAHDVLAVSSVPEYFNDRDTKSVLDRNIDCTYFGKGVGYVSNPQVLPNTLYIGNSIAGGIPIPRPALADLLRQTRILYTYDPISQIVQEAIFCGAMVSVLSWRPIDGIELKDIFDYPNVRVENNNIIVPLNYQQTRQQYIDYYKSLFTDYKKNLARVVQRIQDHFSIA